VEYLYSAQWHGTGLAAARMLQFDSVCRASGRLKKAARVIDVTERGPSWQGSGALEPDYDLN
jgi:hypothetical protein